MDYHGAKEEHILRYLTIAQRDKRPEERQPLGTGIHAFVFFVASPFTYARYAQGSRLKYKRLYLPSNAQVIFNRALRGAVANLAGKKNIKWRFHSALCGKSSFSFQMGQRPACVYLARTDYFAAGVTYHFLPVGDPAGQSAQGEKNREHIGRETERPV